jgi:hypothetical protein
MTYYNQGIPMQTSRAIFLAFLLTPLLAASSRATERFVSPNGPNLSPFTSWDSAATNIQDAIDIASAGDVIWVTNGTYSAGGKVMTGDLTNRVALDKALTVRSLNGWTVTTIQGAGATNGTGAVRCAWLTNGALLSGFTIRGGATRSTGDIYTLESGGGVWCASSQALLVNCLVESNAAFLYGGGVYQGTLSNCFLLGNTALSWGGGAYNGVLNNSFLSGNSAVYGGGGASGGALNSCTVVSNSYGGVGSPANLTNCIVYFNTPNNGSYGNVSYSCTTPLPSGVSNISADPQLFVDGIHLTSASPCRGAGTNLARGTDIFGQSWANPPSIGCAEWQSAPTAGQPTFQVGAPFTWFSVRVPVAGQPPFTCWWTKNGVPIVDGGIYSGSGSTNLVVNGGDLFDANGYQVVVSNAFGMATSAVAQIVIHCVDVMGAGPAAPYSTWATAATNIQDAIDAASDGDFVWVTNGIYASGGKVMAGDLTNRVALNKAIRVQSANGPMATIIRGAGATNGTAAVRCAWLTNGAALSGFTLQGGATRSTGVSAVENGGGAWCASSNAFVGKCIIQSNSAYSYGGGVYQGNLSCCAINGNTSSLGEGSVYGGVLNNCTVISNFTGAIQCQITNSILYFNRGAAGNYSGGALSYCCTTPLPSGAGNISADPLLLPDIIHLSSASPCLAAGTNLVSGTDIDGQPWANPPSIGCDQFQAAPVILVQPIVRFTAGPVGFIVTASADGQGPLTFYWMRDGTTITNDGHYSSANTTNLTASGVSVLDGGGYQMVVSNAFGIATSRVAQVVIHTVAAASAHPVAPFSTWATAATNIQDAINVAAAEEFVLVGDGVYATGGKVMAGDLTNRVALDKPVMVTSINGYAATVIQGAWDPALTNGPGAVRCAFLADGAVLNGFTLQNGATRAGGDTTTLQSGGGVWCVSTNGLVFNCVISNNAALYGGGIAYGTLNNSLVVYNLAASGVGAYYATLNNCTVCGNSATMLFSGAGTYHGFARNSIVIDNFDILPPSTEDNYSTSGSVYSYCCTDPAKSGTGNISVDPQFFDAFHILSTSPCRGAGSALYAGGTDLDGETWTNPPSIGCDEVITSHLGGPLSVSINSPFTNLLVSQSAPFWGMVTGRVSSVRWSTSDRQTITNPTMGGLYQWTNSGDYMLTFTAYNNDHPAGVAASIPVHVGPPVAPQLQSAVLLTNGFRFQLLLQPSVNYTVEYATNLMPPVNWQPLQSLSLPGYTSWPITDFAATNRARFYRVLMH